MFRATFRILIPDALHVTAPRTGSKGGFYLLISAIALRERLPYECRLTMRTFRIIFAVAMSIVLRATGIADPVAELSEFSAFKNIDLSKLAGGEVINARMPAMGFPRGLATQFCYIVPAGLQKTVELHEHWNATRHPELKVYLHDELPAKPGPGDFSKIASAPDNSSVRAFFTANQKADSNQLLMSAAEAKLLKPAPESRATACAFWSDLLSRRAAGFASGGLSKEPPYQFNGETVQVAGEAERLLKEQPKIRSQFSALASSLSAGPPVRQMYWEMSDVEGTAAVSLGALCAKAPGATWQAIDLHYYASGGYFVLLTFYQMWPVTIGSQQVTLVWRADLLSAPSLGDLHGVERLASVNAMTKEIQKSINIFLKDARTK